MEELVLVIKVLAIFAVGAYVGSWYRRLHDAHIIRTVLDEAGISYETVFARLHKKLQPDSVTIFVSQHEGGLHATDMDKFIAYASTSEGIEDAIKNHFDPTTQITIVGK